MARRWTGGNLFIGDTGNNRVRNVSPSGIIVTVAGNGNQGFAGFALTAGVGFIAYIVAWIAMPLEHEAALMHSETQRYPATNE